MFLEILFFVFLGITAGLITGLIPGLHPNTLFAILVSLTPVLITFPFYYTLAFVVSLSVCNTFTNFIPSILFGAPEESSALSVLPGHRMLLSGDGYEALLLTVVGGLGVVGLTITTFPLLLILIPFIFTNIQSYIHFLLAGIFLWMLATERGRNKIYALFIFLLSGTFGLISLNTLSYQTSIFPALTGLFGFSALIISLMSKNNIPKQKNTGINIRFGKGSVAGWLAGLIVGILPGVGAAQAGVITSHILKTKTKNFLVSLGGINTANIIFTFIAFYTIGKTRSGATVVISQIADTFLFHDMLFVLSVVCVAAAISAVLTIKTGKFLLSGIENVPYNTITKGMIVFLIILVFIFTGPIGLLVSLVGTFIGLSAVLVGVKRTHMMGFFMIPTILFFSGLNTPMFLLFGL